MARNVTVTCCGKKLRLVLPKSSLGHSGQGRGSREERGGGKRRGERGRRRQEGRGRREEGGMRGLIKHGPHRALALILRHLRGR